MKIGQLDMHCGNCPIVDYCTHPHETPALCCVQGLQDVDIDDYKKLAEQVTEEEIQIKYTIKGVKIMPLIIPNEGATQEEINAWIIDTQEKYNNMETELEQKTKREKELIEHNQKLYLKITSQKEDKQMDEEKEEVPFCFDEEMYKKLSEQEKQELDYLLEEE